MIGGLAAGLLLLAGVSFACLAIGGRKRPALRQEAGGGGSRSFLPGGRAKPPYDRRPLLSAWERRALLSIRAQLPVGLYVCPQVRLADMLRIEGSDGLAQSVALSRVASKSVDFAIIDLTSGDVALVIELDDSSHDRPERRDRDAFVNAVLAGAGIPLLRFRPDTPIRVRDFFEAARTALDGAQPVLDGRQGAPAL